MANDFKKNEENISFKDKLLSTLSQNAKNELLKYNLLDDISNYKYTMSLDCNDLNALLDSDEIAVYFNDYIDDMSDFAPNFVKSIEFLKDSILIIRFFQKLDLKIINDVAKKIKLLFGKKVPIILASQSDQSVNRIHITFIGTTSDIVM